MDNKNKKEQTTESFFEKDQVVASMTDCTGLVQTPPDNQSEVESYTDIFGIPLSSEESGRRKSGH